MTAPDYQRARQIFFEACQCKPGEREAFVQQACRDDPRLEEEVNSLLRFDDESDGPLSDAVLDGSDRPEVPLDRVADTCHALPAAIGRFTIVGVLGEGGMGVVYEARQQNPERTVALKVMRAGTWSHGLRRRFETEARVLGRLEHPCIARIHEAGSADTEQGRLSYFAMELVRGRPLTQHARDHRLAVPARLKLFCQVCEAVHYAHQQGVIHRDLKPANILVDEHGRPRVLDFGVARVIDSDRWVSTIQTHVGQLLGTLPYMSPEQAAGRSDDVDVRTDVYALGVLLYELLAERSPLDLPDSSLFEAVRIIQEQEPRRLGSIARAYRGDIETIVGKAMHKEKAARYASVDHLSGDIRRYLADEPIQARPPSVMYQLRKFSRRNRALVGAAGAILAALVLAVVLFAWTARREAGLRREAEWQSYLAGIGAADAAVQRHDAVTARRRLEAVPAHLRNWEWAFLAGRLDASLRALRDPDGPVLQVAYTPDGRRIITTNALGRMRVLNAATGEIVRTIDSHQDGYVWFAISPDGGMVVSSGRDGTARVSNIATGEAIAERRFDQPLGATAYSHDGRQIHISPGHHDNGWAGPLDARSLDDGGTRRPIPFSAGAAAWSPDGTRWVYSDRQYRPLVEMLPSGAVLGKLEGATFNVDNLAWSHDGTRIAGACRDKHAYVWDAADYSLRTQLSGHTGAVRTVAFSPDDRTIATGSADTTIRLWDATDGRLLKILAGHEGGVTDVAFSPDGRSLASTSVDGTVRIWSTDIADHLVLRGHTRFVYTLAFSPDGALLASGGWDHRVRIWDWKGRTQLRVMPEYPTSVWHVAFGRDNSELLTATPSGYVRADPNAGAVSPAWAARHAVGLAVAPAAAFAVLVDADGICLFDLDSETERPARRYTLPMASAVAVTHDGGSIAVGFYDGRILVLEPTGFATVATLPGSSDVTSLAFSPDRVHLASGAQDSTIRIWNLTARAEEHCLSLHAGAVFSVAYSPDGSRLVSGSDDTTIRIWDPVTGDEILQILGHDSYVHAVAFSPDGSTIASGSGDHTIRLWQAPAQPHEP